ncbi:hypothetical protein Tco_1146851 [Tanacetum coccineum]
MPVGPNIFDVIIGIDQLSKYHAIIVHGEDIVSIPHGDEILIIQGSGESWTHCLRTLCLSDESLVISLEEIQADDKLHFIEEPMEIMYQEVKRLKQSRIPIVKDRWNSRRGPELHGSVKINSTASIRTSSPTPLQKATQTEFRDEILLTRGDCDNPYFLAFGRHLEEIHVTWAHLEKKRTRLRTNTKTLQDSKSQSLETASPFIHDAVTLHLIMASQHLLTASARTDSTRI